MKTLLAVDDDTDFLDELRAGLEMYGYHVLTEPDTNDAIRLMRLLKPACVLFDLRMPKKHGFQFFDEIKSDPELRRIPAIAMSGFCVDDSDTYLSIFGIKRFLKKPFSPQDVVNMIQCAVK